MPFCLLYAMCMLNALYALTSQYSTIVARLILIVARCSADSAQCRSSIHHVTRAVSGHLPVYQSGQRFSTLEPVGACSGLLMAAVSQVSCKHLGPFFMRQYIDLTVYIPTGL